MRRIHGARHVVKVSKTADADTILSAACSKFAAHDRMFPLHHNWNLYYPDGSAVNKLPESNAQFTLQEYKSQLMKDYQRITLFIACDGERLFWSIMKTVASYNFLL